MCVYDMYVCLLDVSQELVSSISFLDSKRELRIARLYHTSSHPQKVFCFLPLILCRGLGDIGTMSLDLNLGLDGTDLDIRPVRVTTTKLHTKLEKNLDIMNISKRFFFFYPGDWITYQDLGVL